MSAGLRGLFRKARKLPVRIAAGTVLFIPGLILEKTGRPVPALILCLASTLICGADVIIGAVKGLFHGELIDEKFLMTVAAAGAFALGDFSEAAAVMIFSQIGEYFQSRAVRSSRNSIKELMDICPDDAVRIAADGSEERIDAEGQLLCALIKKPELYGYVRPYLSITDFSKSDPFHYTMAEYVLSHLATVRPVSLADLTSQYASVEEQTKAAKLYEFEPPKDRDDLGKFLTQTIRSVKQKRSAELSSSEDPEELVRMIEMKKQLNSLYINIS